MSFATFGEVITDLDTGEETRTGVDITPPIEPYAVRLSHSNDARVRATQYIHGKRASTSNFASVEKFVESFQMSASLVVTCATVMQQAVEPPPFTGQDFGSSFAVFFVEEFIPSFLNGTEEYKANVQRMADYFGVHPEPLLAMQNAPADVKVLICDLLAQQLASRLPGDSLASFGGSTSVVPGFVSQTEFVGPHDPVACTPQSCAVSPEMKSVLFTAGIIVPFFRAWLNVRNASNTHQEDRSWNGERNWNKNYELYFWFSSVVSMGACMIEMALACSDWYFSAFMFLPVMTLYVNNLIYQHHVSPERKTITGKVSDAVIKISGNTIVYVGGPLSVVLAACIGVQAHLFGIALSSWTGAIAGASIFITVHKWWSQMLQLTFRPESVMNQAIAAAALGVISVLPLLWSKKHPDLISAEEQRFIDAQLNFRPYTLSEITNLMERDSILGLSVMKPGEAENISFTIQRGQSRGLDVVQLMAHLNKLYSDDIDRKAAAARIAKEERKEKELDELNKQLVQQNQALRRLKANAVIDESRRLKGAVREALAIEPIYQRLAIEQGAGEEFTTVPPQILLKNQDGTYYADGDSRRFELVGPDSKGVYECFNADDDTEYEGSTYTVLDSHTAVRLQGGPALKKAGIEGQCLDFLFSTLAFD
jgi:hypothetical protein